MVVTGPHGARVACDYPGGLSGAAISRKDLDATLVDAAIAAGVDFMPSVRVNGPLDVSDWRVAGVRIGAREQHMPARVVIAADGRRSALAFGLGLTRFADAPKRWAFGAYFTDVDEVTTRGEMHVRTDGYIGVAGLGSGLTNVCVVREVVPGPADRVAAGPGHRARALQRSRARAIGLRARDKSPACRRSDRWRSKRGRPGVPGSCWQGMPQALSTR